MQFSGNNGYIAIGDEAVAYGTAAATPVYQQAISASLKTQEQRYKAMRLGSNSPTTGVQGPVWAEGPITLAHTDEGDEVGVIYGHMASESAGAYNFGGTPTVDSHTIFIGYGGIEYEFVGGVCRSITWNLVNNGPSTMSLDYIARRPTKQTVVSSPTLPPESEIILPGDLSTFTVGADDVDCLKSATITFTWPATGIERTRLGSSVLAQPIRADRPVISGVFNLEMDDATDSDTVALIDDILADSAGQSVVLDNFVLGQTKFMGDIPDLSAGLIDVPLRFESTQLVVTTT